MSKVNTKIPSGSLTLLTKPNAAGECAVYLRYYLGSYIKKSTDIWVNQKDWDTKRQCVKSSAKNAARINARLYDIKGEIDKALLDYDGPITIDVIRSIMCGDDNSEVQLHSIKTSFIEYARYVNDMKYTKKAYGYSSWYNKVKYIDVFETFIKHFLKKKRFTLEDLNVSIFDEYIKYKYEVRKNKAPEAVNKSLVPLYEAVKNATVCGIVPPQVSAPICDNFVPTREVEYDPDSEHDDKVRYLTDQQIEELKVYQSKLKHQRSYEIMDYFFFSYYACGMRLSDLMTLEWKHIDWDARVIRKRQFKTKRFPDVLPPLCEPALKILRKWEKYGRNKRFVFDMLPEDYDLKDQNRFFMDRNSKDKTINTSLKGARLYLGISTSLSIHVARHSFAVRAINKGISVYLVSKLLGHTSILSTEKTYARFIKEKVDNDTKLLFEF